MPCRWSRGRCCPSEQAVVETNEDGVQIQSWHTLRRQNLRKLRKQTRHIVLLMALMEAMRVGPVQLVYAGTHGYPAKGPEDFGIAYNVGYFISWLYVCLFMIVFIPLFSWWVPASSNDESNPSFTSRLADILKQFNMLLLPFTIGICIGTYIYYALMTLIQVDTMPVNRIAPANSKKNWLVRLLLLGGVAISLSTGYGAFQILDNMDLAHVKTMEYALIVMPIQINLGLLFGSGMQWKIEKRMERKRLASLANKAEEEAVAVTDEKRALLE